MLRDATRGDLEHLGGRASDAVVARERHVIRENGRVLEATAALGAGDMRLVGELIRRAHASQRDDFDIAVPATDVLADHVRGERARGVALGRPAEASGER